MIYKINYKRFVGLAPLILLFGCQVAEPEFTNLKAKSLLQEYDIEIKDDFVIKSFGKSSFYGYTPKFEISISNQDRERIIDQIKSSEDYFKDSLNDFYLPEKIGRYSKKKIYASYENQNNYKQESFETFRKGNAPLHVIISLSKKGNKLIYEKIFN